MKRWRLQVEANRWSINRPYLSWGWELDHLWVGFDFGNHHTDSPLSVTLAHTLSDRQLRFALWLQEKLA